MTHSGSGQERNARSQSSHRHPWLHKLFEHQTVVISVSKPSIAQGGGGQVGRAHAQREREREREREMQEIGLRCRGEVC